MSGTPNYRFNRNPEFSVNHISEYLVTENASQRAKIIRDAKFPKKIEVSAYSQIRGPLKSALSKPGFDPEGTADLSARLTQKAQRETGLARDEALRCEKAVQAFISTLEPKRFSRMQISPATGSVSVNVSGVRLKVTLDALVSRENRGIMNSGGIVILYSFAANRGPEEGRLKNISGLILWALESGQMEPLPRLCMAIDIAYNSIVYASDSYRRFRGHVTEACQEIATRWDSIEAPEDYDGPDWR